MDTYSQTELHKNSHQVTLLTQKIKELQRRYDMAFMSDRLTFRYSLRLKLATTQALRETFFNYALSKAVLLPVDDEEDSESDIIDISLESESNMDVETENHSDRFSGSGTEGEINGVVKSDDDDDISDDSDEDM